MANIVLIASGGIRTPRQIDIAEILLKQGHNVRCLNTTRSYFFLLTHFLVHPRKLIFFLKVMHSPVSEIFCYFAEFAKKVSHIGTSRWADIVVVAPATCNTIGKVTAGITDSYPLLVVRAFERGRKVLIVPSMNPEMWADPYNLQNIEKLKSSEKYILVGPVNGRAVSGETGFGMMAPNDLIVEQINYHLNLSLSKRNSA